MSNYRKHTAIASKSRRPAPDPSPSVPPTGSIGDVPDPPGIEVNDAFFSVLEKVSNRLEEARIELLQLHAMLKCLYEVLLYSDDDDAVHHADVTQVVARLLNDVVTNLELTKNQIPTNAEMARSVCSMGVVS